MFLVKAVTTSLLNIHTPMQNTAGKFQVPRRALVNLAIKTFESLILNEGLRTAQLLHLSSDID